MRIYNREQDLPIRGSGYEFICPSCGQAYVNEGYTPPRVRCPNCIFTWRVQTNGKPRVGQVVVIKEGKKEVKQ